MESGTTTSLTNNAPDVGGRVIDVIRRVLNLNTATPVGPDDELSGLGMDSMRVIDLLLALEAEFGLTLPESMLTAATFRSAATLTAAIAGVEGTI